MLIKAINKASLDQFIQMVCSFDDYHSTSSATCETHTQIYKTPELTLKSTGNARTLSTTPNERIQLSSAARWMSIVRALEASKIICKPTHRLPTNIYPSTIASIDDHF